MAAISPTRRNFGRLPVLHRYHDTTPVEQDNPAHVYMLDLDGDGVLCER